MKEIIISILIVLILLVLGNTGYAGPEKISWQNVEVSYKDATEIAKSLR